jgi:hypothetical protein
MSTLIAATPEPDEVTTQNSFLLHLVTWGRRGEGGFWRTGSMSANAGKEGASEKKSHNKALTGGGVVAPGSLPPGSNVPEPLAVSLPPPLPFGREYGVVVSTSVRPGGGWGVGGSTLI